MYSCAIDTDGAPFVPLWYETPAGFSPGASPLTHPLIDRLRPVLLADGAMGTLIHEAGVPIGTCFDHST